MLRPISRRNRVRARASGGRQGGRRRLGGSAPLLVSGLEDCFPSCAARCSSRGSTASCLESMPTAQVGVAPLAALLCLPSCPPSACQGRGQKERGSERPFISSRLETGPDHGLWWLWGQPAVCPRCHRCTALAVPGSGKMAGLTQPGLAHGSTGPDQQPFLLLRPRGLLSQACPQARDCPVWWGTGGLKGPAVRPSAPPVHRTGLSLAAG